MPTQFVRFAAVLFAALVTRVAASGPDGITVGDLAVQADEATWRNAIANLNATNSTQVTGYNISAEYSKSPEQTPLWELAISVTADIPAKKPAGKFFTGTAINWSPPWELKRNGTVRGDKSWSLCMSVYRGAKLQSGKANVDSTCDGILPDKCVKELQQRASANGVCSTTGSLPSSCVEDMGKGEVEGFGVETSFAGGTNRTSVGFYYGAEREGHDKGNVTAYDDAIRQIWVVVTGFAHNTTDSGRNSARQNTGPEGSLRCLRAETFKDASRSYPNAAPGQQASMVSLVLAAFVSVSIAILT